MGVPTLQGVQDLATTIGQRAPQIDVLINNSGYMGNTLVHNADGIEMHFAVNVVAPWKLTLALLSNLKAAPGARVLNITGGDKPAAVDPSNLQKRWRKERAGSFEIHGVCGSRSLPQWRNRPLLRYELQGTEAP